MMKKIWFLFLACLLILTACNNDIKYDAWKDTVATFGDGTYQILHQSIENKSSECLMNCAHNQCVITEIEKYTTEDDFVYLTGYYYNQKVFCKLNIASNMLSYFVEDNGEKFIMVYLEKLLEDRQIELYTSLNDFSNEDRAVFDSML